MIYEFNFSSIMNRHQQIESFYNIYIGFNNIPLNQEEYQNINSYLIFRKRPLTKNLKEFFIFFWGTQVIL